MLNKRQPYRNKKILNFAKGQDCTMNLPGFCNYNSETSVFAHLNESFAGKGTAQKADDCAGFIGCSGCHTAYDTGKIEEEDKYFYLLRACYRTTRKLIDAGILK